MKNPIFPSINGTIFTVIYDGNHKTHCHHLISNSIHLSPSRPLDALVPTCSVSITTFTVITFADFVYMRKCRSVCRLMDGRVICCCSDDKNHMSVSNYRYLFFNWDSTRPNEWNETNERDVCVYTRQVPSIDSCGVLALHCIGHFIRLFPSLSSK